MCNILHSIRPLHAFVFSTSLSIKSLMVDRKPFNIRFFEVSYFIKPNVHNFWLVVLCSYILLVDYYNKLAYIKWISFMENNCSFHKDLWETFFFSLHRLLLFDMWLAVDRWSTHCECWISFMENNGGTIIETIVILWYVWLQERAAGALAMIWWLDVWSIFCFSVHSWGKRQGYQAFPSR